MLKEYQDAAKRIERQRILVSFIPVVMVIVVFIALVFLFKSF